MAVVKTAWSWSWSFNATDVFSFMFFTGSSSHLRVVLHLVACIASLGLGLRLSKEFSCSIYQLKPQLLSEGPSSVSTEGLKMVLENELVKNNTVTSHGKSSNVHPGRHRIVIRPWPHPDPLELAAAQVIINRVQEEQRKAYEAEHKRQEIIVITTVTNNRCPVEALHLSSLASSLSVARHAVTWIVVGGDGKGNSTSEIVKRARARSFHVKSDHRSHARLRMLGLRFVREKKMEGVIVFLDEHDTPSLDLFEEIEKVNMAAAFAIGFPVVGSGSQQDAGETSLSMLVQRPVYDNSSTIRGWEVVLDCVKRQQEATSGEWYAGGVAFHSKLLSVENSTQLAEWKAWENLQENAILLGDSTALIKDLSMLEAVERKEPLVWSGRVLDPSTCVKRITSGPQGRSWVIHPPLDQVGSDTHAPVPPPQQQGGLNQSNVPSPVPSPVPKLTRRSKKHSPKSVRKMKTHTPL